MRALESLEQSASVAGVRMRVYLVDAASADGTPEAVQSRFPDVHVVHAEADVFWAAGMRLAHAAARSTSRGIPDYYLLYNDDVEMLRDGLRTLVTTAEAGGGLVSGLMTEPGDPSTVTYGGMLRTGRLTFGWKLAEPGMATVLHANALLIPGGIFDALDGLDGHYQHAFADFDLSLRAARLGAPLRVTARPVGHCAANRVDYSWDAHDSVRARWRAMQSPKGLPLAEWALFCRRWAGPAWPLLAVAPLRHVLRGQIRSADRSK